MTDEGIMGDESGGGGTDNWGLVPVPLLFWVKGGGGLELTPKIAKKVEGKIRTMT